MSLETSAPQITSFELTSNESKSAGLSSVETLNDHSCKNEKGEVEFRYYSVEKNSSDFKLDETELNHLHNELGLYDQHFQIYTREQGPIGELGDRKVYFLLHGWTANNEIFSDVHMDNGHSIVEEILKQDPNAVIVSLDGNGFGKSPFLEKPELDGSIQGYAAQVDYLVTNVLRMEKQPDENGVGVGNANARFLGHSMGGATVMELAMKYGYTHCVADAPAYFPLSENIKSTINPDEYNMDRYHNFAPPLYRLVSNAVWLGDYFERRGTIFRGVSHLAVDRVFKVITPSLMGKTITGDPKQDASMIAELEAIHAGELYHTDNTAFTPVGEMYRLAPKLDVVARTLHGLQQGEDVSALSMEELIRLGKNVTVFTGKEDVLVPPPQITELYRVMMTYAAREIKSTTRLPGEELDEGELATDNAVAREAYAQLSLSLMTQNTRTLKGGHYGALFSSLAVVEALTA